MISRHKCISLPVFLLLFIFSARAFAQPVLQIECHVPDSLEFNDMSGIYSPNPFYITVSCRNTGNSPAKNVTALLVLPQGMVLDNPDPLLKMFTPTQLPPHQPGDPLPEVVWKIRYTTMPKRDTSVAFHISVTGEDAIGLPLGEINTSCSTRIEGVAPSFRHDCRSFPTGVRVNAELTGLEPNPLIIKDWKLFPTGWQSVRITGVKLKHSAVEGFALDPSTPAERTVDTLLHRGDTLYFSWIFHLDTCSVFRGILFQIYAYDDEGRYDYCENSVTIDAIPGPPFLSPRCSVPDTIKYNPLTGEYDPNPFTVRLTAVNVGYSPASNVSAFVYLPAYVELVDPIADPQMKVFNPSTLDSYIPGDPIPEVTWLVRYTGKQPHDDRIDFKFVTGGNGPGGRILDSIDVWCSVRFIETVTSAFERFGNPYSYSLSQNYPNPFNPSTVIEYAIPSADHVRLSVFDPFGRTVRTLVNEYKESGSYRIVFNAGDLPSGVYSYRLETPRYTKTRLMVLTR